MTDRMTERITERITDPAAVNPHLLALRERIDAVDREMLALLNRRA